MSTYRCSFTVASSEKGFPLDSSVWAGRFAHLITRAYVRSDTDVE